jgi:hypothetical protein
MATWRLGNCSQQNSFQCQTTDIFKINFKTSRCIPFSLSLSLVLYIFISSQATMTKKPTTSKRRVMFLAKQEATEEMDTDAPTLDVNASSLFEELCTAAKEGDQEKVESLIKNFGAPINVVDDWQCSPLYWACKLCVCFFLGAPYENKRINIF